MPEQRWPALSERLADECEEDWEASADPGPQWEDYCAGIYAGYADRLRGTYVEVEASWDGYDAD